MGSMADFFFLIDLWRKQSWAMNFADSEVHLSLGIPWIVLGEFWPGATRAGHDPGEMGRFLALGRALQEVEKMIPAYAKLCANLQGKPLWKQIGQNDLWIAACCLAWDKPLLTRNVRHFEEMEGLRLRVVN
jgi:predicted nucleic acid-binding protein